MQRNGISWQNGAANLRLCESDEKLTTNKHRAVDKLRYMQGVELLRVQENNVCTSIRMMGEEVWCEKMTSF